MGLHQPKVFSSEIQFENYAILLKLDSSSCHAVTLTSRYCFFKRVHKQRVHIIQDEIVMSEVLSEVVLTFGKFLKTQSIKRGMCDQIVNLCLLLHLRWCCATGEVMSCIDIAIPEGQRNSWAGKQSNIAVIAMASNL